jgi:glutaredoxin
MIILYTKNNCQYCEKVKQVFLERGTVYEERNINVPEFLQEVQALGARTMPFMKDTSANVLLGESEDIIEYISEYAF